MFCAVKIIGHASNLLKIGPRKNNFLIWSLESAEYKLEDGVAIIQNRSLVIDMKFNFSVPAC